jgi:hypothetical protein
MYCINPGAVVQRLDVTDDDDEDGDCDGSCLSPSTGSCMEGTVVVVIGRLVSPDVG